MARKRIVILGGGTGGTTVANRLRRRLPAAEAEIQVVDRDNRHIYQPGLLFVPFGLAHVDDLVRSRQRQLASGIVFHEHGVDHVDLPGQSVRFVDGALLEYDVLVVATGARLQPQETEGLTGDGWNETAFTFYTTEGAAALQTALARFDGGRLVVNLVDMPIKCPVAPLEFAFLADWYLRERGIRARTELSFVTPLDAAFTKPVASEELAGLLGEKEIELVTEFNVGEVDGAAGALTGYEFQSSFAGSPSGHRWHRRGASGRQGDSRERRIDGVHSRRAGAFPPGREPRGGGHPATRTCRSGSHSATLSASFRATGGRCSHPLRPTSSRSATRPTCRRRRPAP